MEHRAGFVNIVGNPNVGKSTLMNQLVGERVSIITQKAQTTRHRILGIVNADDYQIVFSDTPGVLKPKYKLQESMLNFSEGALTDADVLLYVTDVVEDATKNADFIAKVAKEKVPVLLVINKIDLLKGNADLLTVMDKWKALLPQAEVFPMSAKENFNVQSLMKRIVELLPPSPPYATEVIVEKYDEGKTDIHIMAVVYVERDSQKGIVIGHGGQKLKRVGMESRRDIEKFFGKKVFLEIFVKVEPDWRNRENKLRAFGYVE